MVDGDREPRDEDGAPEGPTGAGNGIRPQHERAGDAGEQPEDGPPERPMVECPYCGGDCVFRAAGGGLACGACGNIYADAADAKAVADTLYRVSPEGRAVESALAGAHGDPGLSMELALFPLPPTCDSPTDVAIVVDAIMYYEDTAGRILAAAAVMAEQARAAAALLRGECTEPIIAVVKRETVGTKSKHLDIGCSQRAKPVRVQVTHRKATIKVVDKAACKAELEQMKAGGIGTGGALVEVPEQVIPAHNKVSAAGVKELWGEDSVVAPAGCELVKARDTVNWK